MRKPIVRRPHRSSGAREQSPAQQGPVGYDVSRLSSQTIPNQPHLATQAQPLHTQPGAAPVTASSASAAAAFYGSGLGPPQNEFARPLPSDNSDYADYYSTRRRTTEGVLTGAPNTTAGRSNWGSNVSFDEGPPNVKQSVEEPNPSAVDLSQARGGQGTGLPLYSAARMSSAASEAYGSYDPKGPSPSSTRPWDGGAGAEPPHVSRASSASAPESERSTSTTSPTGFFRNRRAPGGSSTGRTSNASSTGREGHHGRPSRPFTGGRGDGHSSMGGGGRAGGVLSGRPRKSIDPLEEAILELLIDTGALEAVAKLDLGVGNLNGTYPSGSAALSERRNALAMSALALASAPKGSSNSTMTKRKDATPVEDYWERRLTARSARDEDGGDAPPLHGLDSSHLPPEAPAAVDTDALLPRAERIAAEIEADNSASLTPEEVCTATALLVVLADKSTSTIAAVTAVYSLRASAGQRTAKGETAVVWRSDSRLEKIIKQFLRLFDKVANAGSRGSSALGAASSNAVSARRGRGESAGASNPSTPASQPGCQDSGVCANPGSNIEIVANAYDLTAGHEHAKFTLAVLLILLGVVLRAGQPSAREGGDGNAVWLQPVDIHAQTPAACTREWDPSDTSVVIVSVKGPWPWGDGSRSAVSQGERKELAMTLIEGEAPVIGHLEAQASELLEQKKEKHVFLLGETGVGKSSLGNMLVGSEVFHVDPTKTGTMFPQPHLTNWGTERQVVWDSPGLNDAKNRDPLFLKELGLVVDRVQLAAAVVVVVRSAARIPNSLIQALEKYTELFGPQLSSVLYIVINESSRVFTADEIEMYGYTVAEQLADELGLYPQPGFLLQIPTGRPPLPPDVSQLQQYNAEWLKQDVLQAKPVLTRMGQQTIESLLALRTTLDAKQQQFYRRQLLEQSGKQRETLQVLLSRADVRKAYFSKRGYILMQTWDLSRTNRVLQVLQQQDSRMQQRREIRIMPDNQELGNEIAHQLRLRKKHYTSRKEVRATSSEDVFSVLGDMGLVLVPLTVPLLAGESERAQPEGYAAARPGDKVSQRTLKAIADVLADTNTAESVVKLVQNCLERSSSEVSSTT